MGAIPEILKTLAHPQSTSQELEALTALTELLHPVTVNSSVPAQPANDELVESDFLQLPGDFAEDAPVLLTADEVLPAQPDLNMFVTYVFERRYGWSENSGSKTNKPAATRHDVEHKAAINESLDQFLDWLLQEKISLAVLESLQRCILEAHSKPVVRKQALLHLMEWLKIQADFIESSHFELIKKSLLLGLTDVWSAIRSSCVSRLSYIIEYFTVSQLQSFFNDMVEICKKPESSWQAKEGCIMGIHSVIRKFQWIGMLTGDDHEPPVGSNTPPTQYFLKFGQQEFQALPDFISSQIQGVTFTLLAHPQLTVRENAIKAYASYQSRCDFQEAVSSFQEIIQQLCRGTQSPEGSSAKCLPHQAVFNSEFKFMDAYEAEGLLGVCIHLVKHIPPGQLLPQWPLYFSTFSLYLMHPASTVRQTASDLFKFLVAKDSSNPEILKLVLQGLSEEWEPALKLIMEHHPSTVAPSRGSSKKNSSSSSSSSGVAKQPMRRKGSVKGAPSSGWRTSVLKLSSLDKKDQQISAAWEWREGRLLAYELILKFLIKNHWLYTFGASHSAAQDAGPDSFSPGRTPSDTNSSPFRHNRSFKQPSKSYGGRSLQQALQGEYHHLDNGEIDPIVGSLTSTTPALDIPRCLRNTPSAAKAGPEPSNLRSHLRYRRPRASISSASPSHELTPAKLLYLRRRRVSISQTKAIDDVSCSAGAAEMASANLQNRLPTITGYGSPSLHTLGRHYSYYRKGEGQAKVRRVSGSPSASRPGDMQAASLLLHTLALDKKEGESPSVQPVTSKCPLRLAQQLKRILYQTIESLSDLRWELRRMGQQLLPCLVEVIRWYDMTILEELWDSQLSQNTSLLCYGACLALKYSLEHAATLQLLAQDPPTSWQDPGLCCDLILSIVNAMKNKLSDRLNAVHILLQRPIRDKLTGVAMETLMLAHTYFDVKKNERTTQLTTMVDTFLQLQKSSPSSVVPMDGFLSCCVRPGNPDSCTQQMLKTVLSEIHVTLPHFLRVSDIQQTCVLLPQLCVYLQLHNEDELLSKALMDSISSLASGCQQLSSSSKTCIAESDHNVQASCVQSLKQLAAIVSDKSLDVQTSRQILDIYVQVSCSVPTHLHINMLLEAIASRLTVSSDRKEALAMTTSSDCQTGHDLDLDLALRSNDIQMSELPENDEDISDEEDADLKADGVIPESQTLNCSGTTLSPRPNVSGSEGRKSSVSAMSEEGSDWDSWSEDEEEDQSAVSAAFSECLIKLQNQDSNTHELEHALDKLPTPDRRLIRSLLEN